MNMSKTLEVLQGPEESPSQFSETPCEVFCLYTPLTQRQPKTRGWLMQLLLVRPRATLAQTAKIGGLCWYEHVNH